MNRTGIRTVVGHQNKIGRYTAHIARRGPYKFGALVRHPSLAPVAVAGRFVSTYARVVAWMEGERVRAMLAMPLVIAALISWGAGLFSEGMRLRRHSP
jgi:hypothetical protein